MQKMATLLIQNGQLVTEEGLERRDILIEEGTIREIRPTRLQAYSPTGLETFDATNLLIFPGLIDCHVHFREPGKTDAEDMQTGAAAAIAGGITTVCEMPNTDPPTCTVKALEDKIARAKEIRDERSAIRNVDIRFFFGVTKKEHLEELKKVKRENMCGVKLYLGHSTGNQKIEEGIEEDVFRICRERGIPVVCHCEDEGIIQKNRGLGLGFGIEAHSKIRSVEAAVASTALALALAQKHGTHLHIAHLSTKDELDLVRRAKSAGLPITCEVAPHHLFLSIDDYKTLGTLAKMNPPLRTPDHCEALWQGILDGTVDCLATDHAPHTLESKLSGVEAPLEAPSGVPGVETMVPLLLSCMNGGPRDIQGVCRGAPSGRPDEGESSLGQPKGPPLQPSDLLRLLFTNPNKIFSLGKPGITPSKATTLTLVNPLAKWKIEGAKLHSKTKWTPYEGWQVQGKVERVIGIE
jgi:dihydroorotase